MKTIMPIVDIAFETTSSSIVACTIGRPGPQVTPVHQPACLLGH